MEMITYLKLLHTPDLPAGKIFVQNSYPRREASQTLQPSMTVNGGIFLPKR